MKSSASEPGVTTTKNTKSCKTTNIMGAKLLLNFGAKFQR